MDNEQKFVILLDSKLPAGLLANTAAVLALTIGRSVESIIGADVADSAGQLHKGITIIPLAILRSSSEEIVRIREQASQMPDLLVVDVTNAAQTTKNYDDYTKKIASLPIEQLVYLGLALYGSKKSVNRLTGNIGLLR